MSADETSSYLDLIDKNLVSSGVLPVDMTSQFFFDINLPTDLIASMLDESLQMLSSPEAESFSENLAGRIENGRQVKIDISNVSKGFASFKEIVENLGHVYVERFFAKCFGDKKLFQGECTLNDAWIVDQQSNDYNPLHAHSNKSPAGLSGVVYLKTPEFVLAPKKTNRDSSSPGWLNLFFGQTRAQIDMNNFVGSSCYTISPKPGRCVLFSQAQPHAVYPFREEGQRICIAFNLSVWYRQKGITPWADLLLEVDNV